MKGKKEEENPIMQKECCLEFGRGKAGSIQDSGKVGASGLWVGKAAGREC